MVGATTHNRQVWSNMSRGFLELCNTSKGQVIKASSSTESPSFEWYEAQFDPKVMSWYLVFTSGSTKYVLSADQENPNQITTTRFTDDMMHHKKNYQHCMFIPDYFEGASGSPFQRLRLMKDTGKCLAAEHDGSLRLRTLDLIYPHPGTIFVISEYKDD